MTRLTAAAMDLAPAGSLGCHLPFARQSEVWPEPPAGLRPDTGELLFVKYGLNEMGEPSMLGNTHPHEALLRIEDALNVHCLRVSIGKELYRRRTDLWRTDMQDRPAADHSVMVR